MSADILRILVVLLGVVVVAVVLIQQPKEGGMGAFTGGGGGSGASSTVFGAKGSGSFLFKLTAISTLALAIVIIALVKVTNSSLSGKVLSAPVAAEIADMPTTVTTDNDAIPGAEEIPGANSNNEAIPGAETLPAEKHNTEKPQN